MAVRRFPSHFFAHVCALTSVGFALWRAITFTYSTTSLRLLTIGLALIFLGALCSAVWPWKLVRIAAMATLSAAVGWLALPARSTDVDVLTATYIAELRAYDGVVYAWGGEVPQGIDCSGLVRGGLRDAWFKLGLRTFDGGKIRKGLALWMFDDSAKSLGQGAGGQTRPLFAASHLRAADMGRLQAGDLAVTADGAHVLAFLGEGRFIQADPLAGNVIIVDRNDKNPWLDNAVNFVRWTALDAQVQ
jgi:hypothetical protein